MRWFAYRDCTGYPISGRGAAGQAEDPEAHRRCAAVHDARERVLVAAGEARFQFEVAARRGIYHQRVAVALNFNTEAGDLGVGILIQRRTDLTFGRDQFEVDFLAI